jgi:hypothetical protein
MMPVRFGVDGQLESFATPEEKLAQRKRRVALRFWLVGEIITLPELHAPFYIQLRGRVSKNVFAMRLRELMHNTEKFLPEPGERSSILLGLYCCKSPVPLRFKNCRGGAATRLLVQAQE